MANEEEQRATYPRIPAKIWWQLRAAASRSPPKEITTSYLESLLGISEGTAQNLLPNLRVIGLIDSNNKTQPLIHEWRDDETYAKACGVMLERVYPDELRNLAPAPNPDRSQVMRWIMRKTMTGETSTSQMAAFYLLLAKGDPVDGEVAENGDAPKPKAKPKPAPPDAKRAVRPAAPEKPVEEAHPPAPPKHRAPSMHIDMQIHISPQASPEQIEAIFASMAKHLYRD
jgi:hypothetical protein